MSSLTGPSIIGTHFNNRSQEHLYRSTHYQSLDIPLPSFCVCRFEEESSCKRFASAEEVTSHLQQLNLTNCIADKCYRNHSLYPPAFYDCAPQNKLSVSQPTRPPLSVMTISSCPGLLRGENVTGGDTKGSLGHVTEETCAERLINAPSRHMTNEGQRYTSEWVGQQNTLDVGQLISSHSPLKLVDDTSMSHSDNWNSMDRDVCPLVCPVKPEPDTGPPQMCLDSHMQYPNLDQFNYVPVSSDVKIRCVAGLCSLITWLSLFLPLYRVMPPQLSNQIEDGANSLNKTLMSNPQDTITSDKLASSGLPRRENRQLSLLPDSQWIERQTEVVIDDVASDSSDGKVDSPERSEYVSNALCKCVRSSIFPSPPHAIMLVMFFMFVMPTHRPLSVWISPELLDYSNSFQQKEYPLPQTLLDQ